MFKGLTNAGILGILDLITAGTSVQISQQLSVSQVSGVFLRDSREYIPCMNQLLHIKKEMTRSSRGLV